MVSADPLERADTADLDLKRSYVVTPEFTMTDGSTIIGNSIKLKVVHPSVKAVAGVKSVDLYLGAPGKACGKEVAVTLSTKDAYLSGSDRIESIHVNHNNFAYEDGVLYIKDAKGLVAGKTVKVTFNVNIAGQAQNSKQVTTTVNVKVKP